MSIVPSTTPIKLYCKKQLGKDSPPLRPHYSNQQKTNHNWNYPPPLRGPPPYFIKDKTGMKKLRTT